jgi:hypothetical protein
LLLAAGALSLLDEEELLVAELDSAGLLSADLPSLLAWPFSLAFVSPPGGRLLLLA